MLDFMRKNAQSWVIKILFAIIILAFIFIYTGNYGNNRASVVAYINDVPITVKEYRENYQRSLESVRQQNPGIDQNILEQNGFGWQVFNRMVGASLVSWQANKLGITVTNKQVIDKITTMEAFAGKDGKFDKTIYEQLLRVNNLTPGEFENSIRREILLERMADLLTLPAMVSEEHARELFDFSAEKAQISYLAFNADDYKKDVLVTDEDITSYYEDNKKNFETEPKVQIDYINFNPEVLAKPENVTDEAIKTRYEENKEEYRHGEMAKAAHILYILPPGATEADEQKAREELKTLSERLAKGEDFASLIPKDQGADKRIVGSELGWFSKGDMVPEFEEAAFALKPGEVSKPVKTQFGLHIIKLEDLRPAGITPLEDVADEIRQDIALNAAADEMSNLLDAVQEDVVVAGSSLEKAAQDHGLKVEKTELFTQNQPPANLELEDEAVTALFDMEQGEVTDLPLATKKGFIIADVVKVQPATIPPLDEVRDAVKEQILESKGKELATEKANAMAKTIADSGLPSDESAKLTTPPAFGRQGFISGLGVMPDLANAVFAPELKVGSWLPQTYGTPTGAIVARLDERIPPTEEQWETAKAQWMETLRARKREELFTSLIESLKDSANIEMVNAEVLGPLPPSVDTNGNS
ncbi:peptidylprolyl isomerase [Desulfovibrio inopinatus]|uniref:peptidylprolyl isomerase n=1 Tax=Desulfovibrio inopinatus TaxID=102109 RepID=UPI00040688FF|nr:peptidylprolyl isomerase [Desulfovibrio inopinatus]